MERRLDALLTERRQMRGYIADYVRFRVLNRWEDVERTECKILALFNEPLGLGVAEQPSRPCLAQAFVALMAGFDRVELYDRPLLAFDNLHVGQWWSLNVRNRILELIAPLDIQLLKDNHAQPGTTDGI